MERQLEIMKDMGVNAIRTSHNPPAPEVLELCDRMGIVVWDEAFDKWDGTADRVRDEPPLEEYGEKQIRNLVMRDRNHPSVVVWSIGNEIGGGGRNGVTPERVKFMSDFVRKYDPTRPVGMGCHIPELARQPNFDALDLTGWNYMRRYAIYRERYPDKPIIYSESASALSTRGFYELPLPNRKNEYSKQLQVNSYDLNAADWSDIPDGEFKLMKDDRFVAGEFVWTGFDYLGEPTPFSQEAKSSYFGIVDLAAFPRTASTSTAATGGRRRPRCTSCRTGTGPTASARTCRSSSTPTATRRSCSSTANRSAAGRRASSPRARRTSPRASPPRPAPARTSIRPSTRTTATRTPAGAPPRRIRTSGGRWTWARPGRFAIWPSSSSGRRRTTDTRSRSRTTPRPGRRL